MLMLIIAGVTSMKKGHPHPFLFKLTPDPWVKLVVHLLEVAQAGLPSRGGWGLKTTEEDAPWGGRKEGQLQVLWNGE